MTIRNIIDAVGDRLDWIKFYWDWGISDDDHIMPKLPVDISLDSEVEIGYQWFWHCNKNIDTKEISNAIDEHDYQTFIKWFEKLQYESLEYLPSDANIYLNEEFVGTVCIAFKKELFDLVSWHDYECG